MDPQVEYEWFLGRIRKCKNQLLVIYIVMVVTWLLGIGISVFAIEFEDGQFAKCETFAETDIYALTPESVKKHPYVQVQNSCMHETFVYYSERRSSETKYYYLLNDCDSLSDGGNKVIVEVSEELEEMMKNNENDTALTAGKFFTGKLEYRIRKDSKLESFLRNAWQINLRKNMYFLTADYTPADERNADFLAVGIALLSTVAVFVFTLVQRKAKLRELTAWETGFLNKFPEDVVL